MEMHLAETVPKHQLSSPLTFNQSDENTDISLPLQTWYFFKLQNALLPSMLAFKPPQNYVILLISPLRKAC